MARYRKIDVRIWNDEKFRSATDDAKLLFLFLLTHPHMTGLGAMRVTLAGLGGELGWEFARLSNSMSELTDREMVRINKVACYLDLPNFIKYNQPASPNVIIGWEGALDLIPDCPEKVELLQRLAVLVAGMSEHFHKAFLTMTAGEGIDVAELFGKTFDISSERHDESLSKDFRIQKQKQKQKEKKGRSARPPSEKPSLLQPLKEYVTQSFEQHRGFSISVATSAKDWVQFTRKIKQVDQDGRITLDDLKTAWDRFVTSEDRFYQGQGLAVFASHLARFLPNPSERRPSLKVVRKVCDTCGNTGRVISVEGSDGSFLLPFDQSAAEIYADTSTVHRCACVEGAKFPDLECFVGALEVTK